MNKKHNINIAVFASHNGSDLQAIIDGCKNGQINGRVCVVISNNSDSFALERARREGIPAYHISHKLYPDANELDQRLLDILNKQDTDLIILAGYLRKIGIPILRQYQDRIFNIHPALLPKYGGKGMYGIHVHKAVIEAKEKVSGITIHKVNEEYDSGDIVAMTEVPVMDDDTPESLAERILEREHDFLVEFIHQLEESVTHRLKKRDSSHAEIYK